MKKHNIRDNSGRFVKKIIIPENETIAQEAIRLLSQIPSSEFAIHIFTDLQSKCCVIGHWMRLHSENPNDYSFANCNDHHNNLDHYSKLRQASIEFGSNIAAVNNAYSLRYPQKNPKDRVMALLHQMVEAGW